MPLEVTIYAVESVNDDKSVYVGVTESDDIDILAKNEIFNKYFVNIKIITKEILTVSGILRIIEKIKKKYRDDGWKILI